MGFRTGLIRLVTFLGGLYFFLKFVLPETFTLPVVGTVTFGKYHQEISVGLIAVFVMAVGLGLINLLRGHGYAILYLKKGWFNSFALLFGLFAMLTVSSIEWRGSFGISKQAQQFYTLREFALTIYNDEDSKKEGVPPTPVRLAALQRAFKNAHDSAKRTLEIGNTPQALREELESALNAASAGIEKASAARLLTKEESDSIAKSLGDSGSKFRELLTLQREGSTAKKFHGLLFNGLFVSLGSAMFSLLGFYIASAAYRAFRIRSTESALMMGAALLVILGQIPFMLFGTGEMGEMLHHLFPKIRLWLLTVPNSAAFRAIEIGAAIASLIMAFRMWLSIESESFSGKEIKKK